MYSFDQTDQILGNQIKLHSFLFGFSACKIRCLTFRYTVVLQLPNFRYQVVTIGTADSERLQVVGGVPQGSVLAPLFFGIYMNDLPSLLQHCFVLCYVDNTQLLLSFQLQDQSHILAEINRGLVRRCNWCFDNQLLLNPKKTKLLVCDSKQMAATINNFQLSLLGKQLTPVEAARDLGVILDTSLTFNYRVTSTVTPCMSRLGQINHGKHCFDR